MSAVYHRTDWEKVYNPAFNAIVAYVKGNPEKTVEEIATAQSVPYEVAYAVCLAAGFVILPNAAGEIHWPGPRA